MSRWPYIHRTDDVNKQKRDALDAVRDVRRALGVPDGQDLPARTDGGYPILYCDADGVCICHACAQRSVDELLDDGDPFAVPTEFIVFYEGDPEYCSDCGDVIFPAYYESDEDESPLSTDERATVVALAELIMKGENND